MHDWSMATTLVWVVPLVVGLLGGLGSAVVAQHLANRHDKARWRRDDARCQLEREREDAARSYEHRLTAYVDFIKEFHRLSMASDEMRAAWEEEPADHDFYLDYVEPIFISALRIQIFGTEKAAGLAAGAGRALLEQVSSGKEIPGDVFEPLLSVVRRDLKIPDR